MKTSLGFLIGAAGMVCAGAADLTSVATSNKSTNALPTFSSSLFEPSAFSISLTVKHQAPAVQNPVLREGLDRNKKWTFNSAEGPFVRRLDLLDWDFGQRIDQALHRTSR
jgi:hypothetical protein